MIKTHFWPLRPNCPKGCVSLFWWLMFSVLAGCQPAQTRKSIISTLSPSWVVLEILSTRWLPGFARVPYYAPSPCHIHPCYNCHHIKACHPPDKQYTEFIIYTKSCSLFFICNNKVSMAIARCRMGCEYTVYSGYLPWSFISLLPCSLLSSRNPSPARFLPPAFHASSRPFLACSHHQPSLPQPSLPPLTLCACIASLLPLSLPLLSPSLLLSLSPLVRQISRISDPMQL